MKIENVNIKNDGHHVCSDQAVELHCRELPSSVLNCPGLDRSQPIGGDPDISASPLGSLESSVFMDSRCFYKNEQQPGAQSETDVRPCSHMHIMDAASIFTWVSLVRRVIRGQVNNSIIPGFVCTRYSELLQDRTCCKTHRGLSEC